MARSDSFQKKWASVPSQFERPSDALIDRGWAGGAAEDPPEAKWENWWHNRVDEALAEIESNGAMAWFADASYGVLAEVMESGYAWIAAKASTGVQPGSAQDEGHWVRKGLNAAAILSVAQNVQLGFAQAGSLVLADATSAAITITLPLSDAALGVVEFALRRADASSNALTIAASGTDKLMLDTTAEAAGQATTELLFAGDFLRLRSDGAGKWWCVGQAQLPGSIASGLVSYATAGAHTFTVPAVLRSGRRIPKITVVGGGGGGAGEGGSAGGGGGGAAIKRQTLSGVASVQITVGVGGAGGVPGSGTLGASGTSSSFGAYCSATGGQGGSIASIYGGGVAGLGSGGELNLRGTYGTDNTSGSSSGADGGSSIFGGGGRGANGVGVIGENGGGGGGGKGGASAGGAGGAGLVIIEW